MHMKISLIHFLSFIYFLSLSTPLFAQQLEISGTVKDRHTQEPISYATVAVIGGSANTFTDDKGKFVLKVNPNNKIRVSYVGYNSQDITIKSGDRNLNIQLESENLIEEVVIRKPRIKYSNKNNPAVELIRKVIAHKAENRLTGQEFVQYEQYEKLSLAISNLSEKFKNKKIFRNYQFLLKSK